MGFPTWEPAVRCSSGPTSGASAFMRWFVEEYGEKGGFNLGIFNCRTVRGGTTTSLHGEGRACDLGFPVGDPDGNNLLGRLLKCTGRLGIQCIIYERVIYSAVSPEGRPYTGVNPHFDHLHVEFTREASERLTYETVSYILSGGLPRHKPGKRILKEGMKGTDVRWVQRQLEIDDDGIFGPITKESVLAFETVKLNEFPRLRADGIVGAITWKALGATPLL